MWATMQGGQQQSPPLPRLARNGAHAALSPCAHPGWSFYTGSLGAATVNIFNGRVTGTSQRQLTGLAPGTYYWKLFADGCGRRVISDLHTFVVP